MSDKDKKCIEFEGVKIECFKIAVASKNNSAVLTSGNSILVRTVTHYYTGRLTAIKDGWLHLEDAAWIAETSRFSVALATGVLGEVEPYPDGEVLVSLGAVVDISAWNHALPRNMK